ncbi:MAG: hypothetical protein ACFFCQ_13875 [Promethearchaeota archaeon]
MVIEACRRAERINYTIAALVEQKIAIERLTDEKIIDNLNQTYKSKDLVGLYAYLLSLTNEEFKELGEECQTFFNRLCNKWIDRQTGSPGKSEGGVFLFGFFKLLVIKEA